MKRLQSGAGLSVGGSGEGHSRRRPALSPLTTAALPIVRSAGEPRATRKEPTSFAERGGAPTAQAFTNAGIHLDGDDSVLARLTAVLDPGDPDFAIVTP